MGWKQGFTLSALALASCSNGSGPAPRAATPAQMPNSAPTFTSTSALSISENAIGDIYTLSASDVDGSIVRLTLLTTADAGFFAFNSSTGALSLPARLSFDALADAGANNIYDLSFEAQDNDGAVATFALAITVSEAALKAGLPPSGNFELIDWRLELPVDSAGNPSGLNATIQEVELANGYESEFFFTGPDGGMVMKAPIEGAKTPSSSYVRTELREMLRRGDSGVNARGAGDIPNENNWALSSQPAAAQANAGGIDGTLRVTMAVNTVTTTGSSGQVGRVIIGQIHAKDDEPIRLYYRKLPLNTNGSIYAEHEISGGADVRFEIVGDSANNAGNPINGVPLNEKFTYEIIAAGNLLTVQIYNHASTMIGMRDIDMSASGYDVLNDFMYFKAGAYHVNNTANVSEFAQLTIYELTNSHYGYPY